MRVALVHDYLNEFGGAERVLRALSDIYPDAPIYTIYAKKGSSAEVAFSDRLIIQSWFAKLPFANIFISPLRFLLPFIWSSFDFSEFDLVITSASWAVTKGMRKGPRTVEICYLHTPPRYLYGYDTSRDWKNKWFSFAVTIYSHIVNHFMRLYDFNQAQKVDYFVVNSENVLARLKKFYRREGIVIYPPVELPKIEISSKATKKRSYYLAGGRMVAAKNFHLIIDVFNKNGLPLKIYGSGILEEELKAQAKSNIHFVGSVSDQELVKLYKSAKAFIVAQQDEDFGITQIEAMVCGTPVVAYFGGGYKETITDGVTGVFFKKLNAGEIVKAVAKVERTKFKKKDFELHSSQFSKQKFQTHMSELVKKIMEERSVTTSSN